MSTLDLSSLKDKVKSKLAAAEKSDKKEKGAKKDNKKDSRDSKKDNKRDSKDFKKDNKRDSRDFKKDHKRDSKDFKKDYKRDSKDFKKDFKNDYKRDSKDFKKDYKRDSKDFRNSRDDKKDFRNSRDDKKDFRNAPRDDRKNFRNSPRDDKKEFRNKETHKEFKDKKHTTSSNPNESEKTQALQDALRQEALALGATEEDLNLIAEVNDNSDSEQEFDGGAVSGDFAKDLNAFYKGIGFDGKVPEINDEEMEDDEEVEEEQDDEEEEDAEEEEEEDEDEDEEEIEEEEEEKEEEKPTPPSKKDDSDSKSKASKSKKSESESKPKKNADFIQDVRSVVSNKLRIPNRTDWYNVDVGTAAPVTGAIDRFTRERVYDKAQKAIEAENELYQQEFSSNSSQKKFLSQILTDGTLTDKISALTLLVQEAPLHNLKAMDTLIGYCEKKSRTAALQSINAVKDLLVNGLLPDRKLVSFKKQPIADDVSDEILAMWFYEDYLKKTYFKFIEILEHLMHDPILHVRMNVISHVFDLLSAKPEQEANLLRLGINKLGDSDNKAASKTSYQILKLQQAHPAMSQIVVGAVIDQMMKPGAEYMTQYYAVTTLNQTILGREQAELANTLVKTYFALFEKVLVETKIAEQGIDMVGKSERGRKNLRNTGKKGKKGGKSMKIVEKTEAELVEEKNQRLFSAVLTGLNRAFPYASLPAETYTAHLDTLFKITHSSNFNTSVQALQLIHHVITKQQLDSDRYYRTLYESLLDPRVASSSKQGIYLNLLYKSLKDDKDVSRQLAFVKRMLQISIHWVNIGSVAGILFVVMQLAKSVPEVSALLLDKSDRPKTLVAEGEYDPKKRDPKYANAASGSLWEIEMFLKHFHPTVGIYAESIVDGTQQAKPDLGLYTLAHFLDRFVYKNAKEKPNTRGSSIMQPLGGHHTGLLVRATGVKSGEVPVNTMDWLTRRADQVRPDEQFFHQYFTTKSNKIKTAKEKKSEDDEDEDDGEAEVWDALVRSRPEVEMDDEGFDDEDIDFGDAFNSDSEEEDLGDVQGEGEEDDQEAGDDNDDNGDIRVDDDDSEEEEEFYSALMDSEGSDSEANDGDETEETAPKRKSDEPSSKRKRVKISSLPMFASADDYSQYLE